MGFPMSVVVRQSVRAFPVVGLVYPLLHRGVGNEPKTVSFMWCAGTSRRKYKWCNRVAIALQVPLDCIEPAFSNRLINLFAKDNVRFTLFDEFFPNRPEVPFIKKAFSSTITAEWLTGTTSRPNRSRVVPSRHSVVGQFE